MDLKINRYGVKRSLKSSTWRTFLVFCASFRQWKKWKADNIGRDASKEFPGIDLNTVVEELKLIVPSMRWADVFQHLERISTFRLINFRPSESTQIFPKFVPQKLGEQIYDALLSMDLERFVMSSNMDRKSLNAIMILAAMKTQQIKVWDIESLRCVCLMDNYTKIKNAIRKLLQDDNFLVTDSNGDTICLSNKIEKADEFRKGLMAVKLTRSALLGDNQELNIEQIIDQMSSSPPTKPRVKFPEISGNLKINLENCKALKEEADFLGMTTSQVLSYYLNNEWIPNLGKERYERKKEIRNRLEEITREKSLLLNELYTL